VLHNSRSGTAEASFSRESVWRRGRRFVSPVQSKLGMFNAPDFEVLILRDVANLLLDQSKRLRSYQGQGTGEAEPLVYLSRPMDC
jgi:hypothetical protein